LDDGSEEGGFGFPVLAYDEKVWTKGVLEVRYEF
jgi:hypothetical protein